ncbi:MAG TPA: putative toxin-antitoxin system toxin component, PIN family [Polyangiaceae bacterium]
MRAVLDTNTVVSALLWEGPASRLLAAARDQHMELLTSATLLDELLDVLPRRKFSRKIQAADLTVTQLVHRYALLARQVIPASITARIAADPDDDAVLACALAAQADLIVSGDGHLLTLKHSHGIQIVTAVEALQRVAEQSA